MSKHPSDPFRFDLARLFGRFGRIEKLSLRSPRTSSSFVGRVRSSLAQALRNEAFLHGLRAEALFEAMVVSLGAVRLFKVEDTGNVYPDDDTMRIPDFRVVLDNGAPLLIEVKNFYFPLKPFKIHEKYLGQLQHYADLVRCDLRIAIYWARWNIWTLISPRRLRQEGGKRKISFTEAFAGSEMAKLGDMHVGTKFPLCIRFIADKTKGRRIGSDGRGSFTIGAVEVYSEDRPVIDKQEKAIALALMFYGKWPEIPPKAEIEDGQLEFIEYGCAPEEDHGQGFEIAGALSQIFCSQFHELTTRRGRVEQTEIEPVWGSLGGLIPKDYKGKALPLWIFEVEPKPEAAEGGGSDPAA